MCISLIITIVDVAPDDDVCFDPPLLLHHHQSSIICADKHELFVLFASGAATNKTSSVTSASVTAAAAAAAAEASTGNNAAAQFQHQREFDFSIDIVDPHNTRLDASWCKPGKLLHIKLALGTQNYDFQTASLVAARVALPEWVRTVSSCTG